MKNLFRQCSYQLLEFLGRFGNSKDFAHKCIAVPVIQISHVHTRVFLIENVFFAPPRGGLLASERGREMNFECRHDYPDSGAIRRM